MAAAERLHGCHPRGLRAARRLPPHRTAPPPAGLPGAPRTAGRSRPAPSPDVRPGPAAWRAPSPALPPASEEPGGKRSPAPSALRGAKCGEEGGSPPPRVIAPLVLAFSELYQEL